MDENKIYHVNNKAGMVILIGEKSDFATRNIIPGIKKHNVNSKRSIHPENITILNVYVCNRESTNLKQKPNTIHVNAWQKPLQYCKVTSLQLK